MLELTPLRYFLSALETGSFSHAAKVNGVSQPTISAAIQKLEASLGGSLFARHRRGLTPTPLGERLYAATVTSVAQLSGVMQQLQPVARRPLRLFCQPDVLLAPLAPGLNALKQARPELFLSFTDTLDEADLAFLSEECCPAGHDFQLVRREEYGVALCRGHALAIGDTVDLGDLAGEPRIHRPYCPRADSMPTEQAVAPLPPAQAVHDQQVLDLVAAGLGVAFVPLSHAQAHSAVVVRPLRNAPQIYRSLGISARRNVFFRDVAQLLADLV